MAIGKQKITLLENLFTERSYIYRNYYLHLVVGKGNIVMLGAISFQLSIIAQA
jgi:hypothetical protein